MWNMKCFVTSVIIGGMGIVSKCLKKSGNSARTTFNRYSTKKIRRTRNITHHKESATV
jgi:hypothetical protein